MAKHLIAVAAMLLFSGVALAQENVTYPVAELGGCSSKQECKTYCDNINHIEACISFGESHGLMKKEDSSRARAALMQLKESMQGKAISKAPSRPAIRTHEGPTEAAVEQLLKEKNGPGGCSSKNECQAYCETESNREECMNFALENNLMTAEQVAHAKKFINKVGPGGCKGEACKTYCEDETRAQECISFAEENGFISTEEAERAKKFVNKPGPGGCRGKECKAYCENTAHMEECMSFALENGFITKEEAERAKNFQQTLTGKTGPGGCRGEECRTYCDDPAHQSACMQFAEEHGFAKPRMMEPTTETWKDTVGTPQCGSPEECRKMYDEMGGRQEYPGKGDPRYMGNEQFRKEGDMMAPPGQTSQVPPERQMTPEERQRYEQYQRGERPQPADNNTMVRPPMRQPTDGAEQYKEEYQRQYEGQYKQEYQRQYEQQQRQQQMQNQQQPPADNPRPQQMTPTEQQQYQQPPTDGQYRQQPQPTPAPEPTSILSHTTFSAAVWTAFKLLFAF